MTQIEGDDWECEACGHLLLVHIPTAKGFVCDECIEDSTVCIIATDLPGAVPDNGGSL